MRNDLQSIVSSRKEKIRQLVREKNLDGLILTRIENVRYISGLRPVYSQWFRDAYAAFLKNDGKVTLFITTGDLERSRRTLPWIDQFVPLDSRRIETIESVLHGEISQSGRIGYDSLDVDTFLGLKQGLSNSEFIGLAGEISKIRAIKTEDELKIIAKGAKVTERAIELAVKKARDGIRECELSAIAESEARSSGAEGVAWSFATFGGEHAGLMYRHDTMKPLKKDELLIMGYAITFEGYNTDITATTVVGGSASREQKENFGAVLEAYEGAFNSAAEGESTRDLSMKAASIIESRGIKKSCSFASFQSLLHGLGMNVYEPPLSPDPGREEPNYILKSGNVLAIEPAIAFLDNPRKGGIRIGETIVIRAQGQKPKILGRMPEETRAIFSKK
jgi:Xaa-Pro aminopeptidase